MIPIEQVYPEHAQDERERGHFYGPGDYCPLLNSMGYEILVKVDENDYQGDSLVLYRGDAGYGILNFGWGSCSGCDALQACDKLSEIEELRTSLNESIKWFPTAEEAMDYIEKHDWHGDYVREELVTEFVTEARNVLLGVVNGSTE